ncbi:MAG: serine/threonine protein kinase [Myxococcales bacterium]|nr:serine/threonine protein kinase [Myxococcales bacterium]
MSVSVPPSSGSTSRLAFPGAILAGRYRLEEIVGHGGMGSVWRATHTGLGEQVAVKLVSVNFVRSPEALRRFDTEAKAAARLRSRHVPQVFDNGVLEDGTPFLVMELLRGESLAARVHRLGPIPLPETISILEQCCRALSRAHSLGIVHRDIKPENVYLAQSVDDDGYIVKVLDFGIAKVTSALSDDGRSSTRTGTLLGTPLYMSPAQARGLRTIDTRTDVYSLGLVAYTMLTGRLPFAGETLGQLLLQICAEPLPRLREFAPGLPPALDDWFQRACARQPEDRFPSPQAFIEALRVAAGISQPGTTDLAAVRMPSYSEVAAQPPGSGQAARSGLMSAAVAPSTTSGTALGPPLAGGHKARWLLASASLLLAVGGIAALLLAARDRRTPAPSSPIEIASSTAEAVPAQAQDVGPPLADTLAPLPTPPAPGEQPSSTPPAPAATPRPVAVAPPATSSRPATPPYPAPPPVNRPAPPRPTAKSNGAIDLGY